MSPNIIPNWNGKVTIVNIAGLTSWYLGIPYVSTICWKGEVKSFISKNVGGVNPILFGSSTEINWL